MISVELTVGLKIPDLTALTAANAIRRRLGYADALQALHRSDYYRLDLDVGDRDAAEALARELAEETNLFVNPNKHTYQVRFPEDHAADARQDGEYTVNVLVSNPDDSAGEGILSALRGRLGYGDRVRGVDTGVLWTMQLAADSPGQAREIAEDIAVTRSQSEGILINPHFQDYEMWLGE
ncbi:MAG: hypothetical protein U9R79_04790 [Armatimonadota bacterium]|nr:hypothetical protein [Armatimonadota bacterium]